MKWPRVLACVLALMLNLAVAVSAQKRKAEVKAAPAAESKSAAVIGTVSGPNGAAVAGATVTVESSGGFAQSANTDAQGSYELTDLPAGPYKLSVEAGGVKIFEASVELSPGQTLKKMIVPEAPVAQPGPASTSAPAQSAPGPASPATAAPEASPFPALAVVMPTLAASASGAAAGSIGGTVNDQTGAVVMGATVTVSNAAGVSQTAATDDKGSYLIKGLPAGSYTITVTAPGFKKFEADNVALGLGQQLPLDAGLEPGGEKTEVNVEGQRVASVETETAQVAGTVTEKEVLTLGLNGRNFTQLIALTPGVSNQTGQDEAKVGVTGSVKYSVNGGRVEYNTFEVDGGDVLNAGLNGAESTLMVYPSLDAIQEVKVLTSNYGAMYGRTASGTVMVTTKGGGAKWHGSGYEFIRNEFFNSRNYFDQTNKAPLYRRNDFGFTLGGPLYIPGVYNAKKDKTFVFWSEEFRIEKSPSDLQPNFNQAVPSLAERTGDFSDVCPPSTGTTTAFLRSQFPDCPSAGVIASGINGEFFQEEFPNNNIAGPGSPAQLDLNAVALLNTNLIPLPNSSTGCSSTTGSCYDAVISVPTHWREELFRVDHSVTSKLRATFRYIHDSWDTVTPVPQWGYLQVGLNGQNSFPTVQNNFNGPGISLVANLTHTISPTLLNQFTASYANSHITLTDRDGPGGANFQRPAGLGMPGGSCTPATSNPLVMDCPMGALFNNGFGGKAPGIIISGNQEYGGSGFSVDPAYMTWEHTNPTFGLRDDVSKSLGKHTLQFGVQLIYSQKNETNNAVGAASGDLQGVLTFDATQDGPHRTGNAFADFLALFTASGAPLGFNAIKSFTQDSAQQRYYTRYKIAEPYVQDDWKINSRLTLNLGVRFSLFGLFHEKYLKAYNWDPAAFDPALAFRLRVDPASGQLKQRVGGPVPLDLNNLDPRIINGIVHCGTANVPAPCMKGKLFNPAPRIGFAWDPRGDGKTSIRAGYGMFYEHGTGQEANTGALEGSSPLILNMTQNFPVNYGCIGGYQQDCATPNQGGTPQGAFPISVTGIPTQAVWSYAQQWSLSVQRQLPKSLVATVAYVGSKGTHLTAERKLSQLRPLKSAENPFALREPLIPVAVGSQSAGDCGGFNFGTPGFHLVNGTTVGPESPAYINLVAACQGVNGTLNSVPDSSTLRRYPGIGEIFSLQNVADSSYHALQATVRRTQGPLTMGVSFSYSHSLDDSSDRSDTTVANSSDLGSNRASSNFDQRHLLSVSYIYSLPDLSQFFQKLTTGVSGEPVGDGQETPMPGGPSRLLKWLGDGWQISGITSVQSGTPFSVLNKGSSTVSIRDNAGVANGILSYTYPDVVGDPHASPPLGGDNPQSFGPLLGNPNAFAAPRGLTFGDAGRNFFNNPRRINFDLSLLKHFAVGESKIIELRAEAFNIFNHTQFRLYNPDRGNTGSNVVSCYGGPNYTAGFSNVGQITPGGIPLGGTDCLTGSSFLHPVDAHRPRTIQLGVKFTF